ncbi:MAG: NYN domain-containing protein [Planctomycetes bacterium]|nr:NYN domain-containing protein [Planctomycetota bacterium]MBL7008182.1 NYN domain-containing protein [Planctomycetota bacterium]
MSETDIIPPEPASPEGAQPEAQPAFPANVLPAGNPQPNAEHPFIDQSEGIEDLEREELEDKYLDMKDEVWRLRRQLNLNPSTGELPSNGGYASPGGFLKRQRVAVFIDVQNMYHSAKKTYGRNLSYAKMLRQCVRSRRLSRAIAYVIDREGIDQVSFLDHLRYCGFEVRKREVIERMDGSRKAEWEIGIAMDMLRVAEKVDVIIAVSGNGVFADVADAVRAKGCKFECCAFRESMSDLLLRAVDQYHVLTEEHLY